MRFRPLSRDPFTDIGRTIPEFRSVGLAESKEFNGFSVDEKNVFEIDGKAARFLFHYTPQHVDMFSCNPAAYKQHHETFRGNESIDSAAHFFGSILLSIELVGMDSWTSVPSAGLLKILSTPPILVVRSRMPAKPQCPSRPFWST